jgi:hypothetical protein
MIIGILWEILLIIKKKSDSCEHIKNEKYEYYIINYENRKIRIWNNNNQQLIIYML